MGPRDIGWAIRNLRDGERVRRPHWGEGFYVNEHMCAAGAGRVIAVLMIHMPLLNRVQTFTCHHDDLYATDWELA